MGWAGWILIAVFWLFVGCIVAAEIFLDEDGSLGLQHEEGPLTGRYWKVPVIVIIGPALLVAVIAHLFLMFAANQYRLRKIARAAPKADQ